MYNLTQSLKSVALSKPAAIATIMGNRQHTWSEMQSRVSRLACALRELGVCAGDRVAMLSLNSDRYLEYYFAVWWSGGVVVPLNTRWSSTENAYAINDSGARVLLVDHNFSSMWGDIAENVDGIEKVIFCGDGDVPDDMLDYESIIREHSTCEDANRGENDLAGIYYTGGTTGFPKGVMLSHSAMWYNNIAYAPYTNYNSGGVYLHSAPMFHLADAAYSNATISSGMTHTFLPSFDALNVIEMIENHRVTHAFLVPTMWGMLLSHPQFEAAKLASLHTVLYGASPMPEGLLTNLLKLFPTLNVVQGYGQTELGPIISFMNAEDHRAALEGSGKLRSAGVAVPGVEVRICDEEGKDLPNGEVGEIYARSPGSMLGYWNLPEQTASTLEDGWVKTGDGAIRDDDGFLYIVDRMKDMIVSGGENVFSAEVESAISTHPDVEAVAVIGIPSEKWGESVHAIIIPKKGAELSEESILSTTKEKIANYKQPRSISFRTEPFPLSGAGKVLKRELREPYWNAKESGVN
ncbi:long-chain-fatty-acid--CoA ligase [Pseudomaricurvus alkylphenolicus]|uniref:long-chain-fatty-acid--CoA ligase n=1 Tax=Pseudomaricurvus alkylphenolicus TaxID=1306991 RepID=UPI001422C863|nr:long-chain-fatty-acid--CoA ligase [Pseudomaricurvus alkylphenolicus]NIB38142.1 long-chain-fatty-acid--CoA ligase [Pseudomaricurvus alkylphenolicus]